MTPGAPGQGDHMPKKNPPSPARSAPKGHTLTLNLPADVKAVLDAAATDSGLTLTQLVNAILAVRATALLSARPARATFKPSPAPLPRRTR
jgi:hypothetical protein